MNLTPEQIRDRLGFIHHYIEAQNPASGSEVDSNANVTHKTLATLEAELYKPYTIELNRRMVCEKLRERFGDAVANSYINDLKNHLIYIHDETSLKPYCASISLYPFLLEGTKSVGGVSGAPKNLQSFCGGFVNLIYQIASNFAGAVEAAASTGGQLMPPVMGAAAFLMAEFVGVPYFDVVKAATIPAILYFLGIWLGVHFEARRSNLKGVPRSELPKPWEILKERGHLAIPLIVIIYLLVSGFTPMRAALWAIVLAIAASSLRKSTRMKPVEIVRGLENGARNVLGVLVACASAGIIIGVVTKTGVGLKLASALLDLSGGMLLPTMFFTMITSIILGMGVPTTANYVITSTIAAPALVQMGVPVLAAHMFVFYFGIIADVTPPVALAAFAGSAISGGKPLKTGINASKLAIAAFIIPYIFVLSPVILMIDATPISLITVLVTSIIGMIGLSASMIGCLVKPLNGLERVILFVGGLLMIQPGLVTDLVGFLLLASVLFFQQRRSKAEASSLG